MALIVRAAMTNDKQLREALISALERLREQGNVISSLLAEVCAVRHDRQFRS